MITRYSDALSASGPTGIAAESFDRSLVAWGRNRKARRKRRRNGSGVLGKVWLIVGLVLGLLIGSVRGARGYDIGGSGDGDDGSNADNVIEDNGRTKPDLDPNSGSGSEDAVVTLGAVASATAMSKASATTTATVTVTVSDADTSSTGTCPKESEGYILKLGDALLSLYGRERQCFTGSEMRQWDRVVSPSSVPSSTALSADTISSSSQAASSDATIDPDSSDSLFDAALFLSFEDWKKRNLEKAGQSPDHIGSSSRKGAGGIGGKKGGRGGSANGAGTGRKRPGNNIHNALDALGDDVEIEWGGFGGTDGGRVEDGRESVSKRVDEGSRDKDGIVDARIVNFAERGGEGSEDTTAQDKAAVAPLTGASTRSSSSREAGKTCKERFNYASFDCGATVLKTNAEGKSPSAVLVEHKDSYMLNECGAKGTKFLIVELCADILVDTVVLANYEFFSSMFRTFRVSVSDRYPPPSSPSITPQRDNGQGTGSNGGDGSSIPEGTNDSEKDTMNSGNKIDKKDIEVGKSKSDGWRELGIFEARNSRDIQAFAIENPLVWARYLRVEFLSHYGSEFYCPVSLLRVHGTTMMEEFRYQQEEAEREHEAENEIVGNEEEDVEGTEDSTEDQVGIDPDKSFVIDVTEQNAVKVHASPKNASPEETSTEGGQSDSHGVISSSDGLASSSIDPYSTSSSIEANSVNNPQQQQSASQDMEKEQLDPIDTLALATTYSNLTMDQLLGMVNEHFKYAGRNYSGASDQQVSDNADEASDIGDAIADAGAESSVKSTPAVIVANTISAKLGTSTSEGLSDATIATENFTETVDIDSKTGTPRNDDNYYTATQATYESGTIVSSSTSIASADAYTHESTISQVSAPDQPESSTSSSYLDLSQSLLTPSTTSIIYASSSSTISQSSISFSTPVSSSSSSSSSLSSSITSYSPSVASTSSSSTRPPSPNPTTQESFFKTVHKRLQMLESNATLSLQYIEDQSRILRDAFLKVERRQSAKIDEHLARLSENITEEIGRYVSLLIPDSAWKREKRCWIDCMLICYVSSSAINMIKSGK